MANRHHQCSAPHPNTTINWCYWSRIAGSEALATAYLVFLACMSCMGSMSPGVTLLHISLAFGFVVMMIIQCFGHISGSHINPAITVLSIVLGHKPAEILPVYVVSQIVGAIVGMYMLKAITPAKLFDAKEFVNELNVTVKELGVCSTVPHKDLHIMQAFAVEFFITAMLCALCCSVWDWRNRYNSDSVPIKFGLTIGGLALVAAPYSGASMNPARSLGPAIVNNDWEGHWIYWIGPLCAAVVVGLGYRFLCSSLDDDDY